MSFLMMTLCNYWQIGGKGTGLVQYRYSEFKDYDRTIRRLLIMIIHSDSTSQETIT